MTTVAALSEGDPAQMDPGGGSPPGSQNGVRQRLIDNLATIQKDNVPFKVMGIEGVHAIPDINQLVAQVHAQGMRVMLYMNPFVGTRSADYGAAAAGHFLATNSGGQPYTFFTVYNAPSAIPDFTQASRSDAQGAAFRQWWGSEIGVMLGTGADGFMLDFGEEVQNTVPPLGDMHFANGMAGLSLHNAYPTLYHAATRSAADSWAQAHD